MPLIRSRINYRYFVLGQPSPGDTIGVLITSGEYLYYPWRGFIERDAALSLDGAVPVKLYATAYCAEGDGLILGWIDLKPGEAIQGCWHDGTVRCVTVNGVPRVIARTAPDLDRS